MKLIFGNRKNQIGVIATVIAVPITSLLLPINEHMRIVHLVELGLSMITFGLICGLYLIKMLHQLNVNFISGSFS